MTTTIFNEFLLEIYDKMRRQNKNVLLLLDNPQIHPKHKELTNVELFIFLPNTTSLIQPLDQGKIKTFKDWYCKFLQKDITLRMEEKSEVTFEAACKRKMIVNTFSWTIRAWTNINKAIIINCFRKGIENYNPENDCTSDLQNDNEANPPTCLSLAQFMNELIKNDN